MKQPELGKKIAELRKSRGLTQEELVDKCNVSVRTIQRIETGDVSPRSYTIKMILDALDYDLEIISDKEDNRSELRILTWAMAAGIAYFILGFPEGIMDTIRIGDLSSSWFPVDFGAPDINSTWYVIVKLLVLVSYLLFMRGFYTIGKSLNNSLLSISSLLLVVLLSGSALYDIASIFYSADERLFVIPVLSVSFGILGMLFGASLIQMNRRLGIICLLAGLMEILAGIFFVLITPIGFFFLIPAEIFEIIILYKAYALLSGTYSAEMPRTSTMVY